MYVLNTFNTYVYYVYISLLNIELTWDEKNVIFTDDGYAAMLIGRRVLECRHGPDHHTAAKEKYQKMQNVSRKNYKMLRPIF